MVYQVAVSFIIALRAGISANGDTLGAMLPQKGHPLFTPLVPSSVMARVGQYDDQLNIAVLWQLLQLQQDLPAPHIHAQGPAHQEPANALLVEQDELLAQALL